MLYDYIIIGGGIVGLATALQLQQRFPDHKILLLEKEKDIARHQTGHNSGVIHSGLYYQPGSFKARFCQSGADALKRYCREKEIPFRTPGKLVVATSAAEVDGLKKLFSLSGEHGIERRWLKAGELSEIEPNVQGLAAIQIPGTAIVDYRRVAKQFAADFLELGGSIKTGAVVRRIREDRDGMEIFTDEQEFRGRFLLACGGLQSDRLARQTGIHLDFRIVPVRGEYYQLPEDRHGLVQHLIYPVPVPGVPFLGVHLTPMINGRITVGPNAVFAWRREGYTDLDSPRGKFWRDARDSLAFPGFWRMGLKYWRFALAEGWNSRFKGAYLARVRKYCPQLTAADLQPYPAGIRAQAVARDGSLIQDFLFAESPRSLHVCNAPSPAATSSIPIGAYLCDKLTDSGRV